MHSEVRLLLFGAPVRFGAALMAPRNANAGRAVAMAFCQIRRGVDGDSQPIFCTPEAIRREEGTDGTDYLISGQWSPSRERQQPGPLSFRYRPYLAGARKQLEFIEGLTPWGVTYASL